MFRRNDASLDATNWTNRKLISEIDRISNFTNFSVGWNDIPATYQRGWHEQVNKDQMTVEEFVKQQTQCYRDTWLNPLLAILRVRLIKE